jgi:hypothetical protein
MTGRLLPIGGMSAGSGERDLDAGKCLVDRKSYSHDSALSAEADAETMASAM